MTDYNIQNTSVVWKQIKTAFSFHFPPVFVRNASTTKPLTESSDIRGKESDQNPEWWERQKMNGCLRPASFLRTLSRPPPVKAPCRPSAFSAGNSSWTPRTTEPSTAAWKPQSRTGRPKVSGGSWTRELPTRSTARAKLAWTPGWVCFNPLMNLRECDFESQFRKEDDHQLDHWYCWLI